MGYTNDIEKTYNKMEPTPQNMNLTMHIHMFLNEITPLKNRIWNHMDWIMQIHVVLKWDIDPHKNR